jgi:hypothetical protein
MKLLLDAGELLDLGTKCGNRTLRCETGLLWVTIENDSRDLFLRPGRNLRLPHRGRVVVQAMGAAKLQLSSRAEPEVWTKSLWLQKKRALV